MVNMLWNSGQTHGQRMGRERPGLGLDRAGFTATTARRRPRTAVARHARGVERRAVGAGQRIAVVRNAGAVSAIPDLPSALPTVGARGQIAKGLAALGPAHAGSGRTRLGREFHRRDIQQREKGGFAVGPTRRGKGSKILLIADRGGLPIATNVDSASPAECKLVEAALAGSFLDELPERMIGDKAYDSDALDMQLRNDYGIELIAPNRRGRGRTQDGRVLRRYRRRWLVERVFAWLHNFRRLVVRWEYHVENFLGMVQLGCLKILLRSL